MEKDKRALAKELHKLRSRIKKKGHATSPFFF